MAHHKPTSEQKDGDTKTCAQKFDAKVSAVGHFFKDNFNKLKEKMPCTKHPKNDDNNPAPSVGPKR